MDNLFDYFLRDGKDRLQAEMDNLTAVGPGGNLAR
jgi:hypothetical protein